MPRLVVSQNERILLHLSDLERFRDEPEVPMAVSQEGIARALGTQVHNASRALSSLESEGLVFDRLAHVRGAPKRRRAYFLTEIGRRAADGVREDILKREVVVERDAGTQELSVEEAIKLAAASTGRMPGFLEFLEIAREADTIDLGAMKAPEKDEDAKRRFIAKAYGRPKVEAFFGREKELRQVNEDLAKEDTVSAFIWGIPGIGKSTLGSKLFEERLGKAHVLWYTVREWDTFGSFHSALTDFLSAAGAKEAGSVADPGRAPAELFLPLVKDLSATDAVLFIDDVHKASDSLGVLVSMIMEATRASRSARTVLMSRSLPSFISVNTPGIVKLELGALDRDAAWKMAHSAKAVDASRAVEESHGHPLLLRLIAQGGSGKALGDVNAFLEQEVYVTASEAERGVLELLSVFRHPVGVDALPGTDYSVVTKLKQRALVTEDEDGLWTHEVLRDFFRSRLTADRQTELHGIAGEYCERQEGAEWALEALYHHVTARNWTGALAVFLGHAADLERDFQEETLGLVDLIPTDAGADDALAERLFLTGRLNEALGRAGEAIADYGRCLELMGEEDETGRKALVLETLGRLQTQEEMWSESVASHQEALKLYEEQEDSEGQTREWLNMGAVYRRKGDFPMAREAYNNALSIATRQEDRSAQAACLNNLALLDWNEGRLRDAEIRLKESVRLAHAVKDHSGEGRALENLAALFKSELRTSDVANMLLEAGEAYRRAGELAEFKRVHADCAEALTGTGKTEEAVDMCRKALERPELRRRRGLFQRQPRYDSGDVALCSSLIGMLRESGDLKAAVKEVARLSDMAESSRDRGLAARAELEQALISEESGDLKKAKEHLARAGGILKEAGDRSGLVAVHIRTGMVDEKMGDEAGAASQYEEAVRQAELSGDKLGLASALENLGLVLGEEEERGSWALNRAAEVFLELGLVQHARRLRRSGS
jgi:tetratricopeptide (TPR) repeat protein/DNA-binding MarR family transcriptional regulator